MPLLPATRVLRKEIQSDQSGINQTLSIALQCKGVDNMEKAEKAYVFTTFDTLNSDTEIPQNDITANDYVVVGSRKQDIKRKYMKAKKDELKHIHRRTGQHKPQFDCRHWSLVHPHCQYCH